MSCVLHHGDCRELLVTLPDCSVDAVVTDPPYELGFMGKKWDNSGIAYSVEMWREVLRVLKPGGHLCAFGGTRTYHRMAVAIEDSGFEIRDSIHWIYGSGFPKSLDVSKAIDKASGAERQWEGWGTALKPAHEPIVLARKALIGTVAANVLEHGTGALNIDGCRIATDDRFGGGPKGSSGFAGGYDGHGWVSGNDLGRWPANVIFDLDAAAELDRQSGVSKAGAPRQDRGTGGIWAEGNGVPVGPQYGDTGGASRFFTVTEWSELDAPFRYVAKPGKKERNAGLDNQNHHPTVKPVALMRYLVRLVTPPNGTVLDPFAGSGTTLMAAVLEGFNSIGIEMTDDYLPIILGRVAWAESQPKPEPGPIQEELF